MSALPEDLPGYRWRAATPADAAAIRDLYLACAGDAGEPAASGIADFAGARAALAGADALGAACAMDEAGRLAAFGGVSCPSGIRHEYRLLLHGAVLPADRRRGLGGAILAWAEARARAALAALPRDRPAVLRVDTSVVGQDATALLARHGFRLHHVEEDMTRDLRGPLPDQPPPPGVTLVHWEQGLAARFYAVYRDAFSTRPGAPGWTEEGWVVALTGSPAFRPARSYLLREGDEDVGFLIAHVDPEENARLGENAGWLAQLGVRPGWRGRGLAAVMIAVALCGLRDDGLDTAMLDVNVDNPGARRVYERLGFAVVARRASYTKTADGRRQAAVS
ncbi:MAG TPA: GNAT family N-acetyltransferase [Thermomicrobiales bacterium]|nr:GNAT family N-acetyltransferase [Thermomicrobiales bacterium]